MKGSLYPRLAWSGIVKNRKLYYPYILTCVCMIAMLYIVQYLSLSSLLSELPGGGTLAFILSLGLFVIGLFALFFLLYSSSFLIRRRNMEFGLYNILGMGKGNISCILLWESLFTFIISVAGGMVIGILLSKLAELVLVNVVHGEVDYRLYVSGTAVFRTCVIFAVISVIILARNLIKVGKTNAIALLHSENFGEKPPKSNWVLGIAGIIVLGAAYWLALKTTNPYTAVLWFFGAVMLVIAGTYLVFIAASVLVCRILQKNKRYYYKANHFISVSSMAYRMKRNGAGLATICVLATMVLVMISSTTCLYYGIDDMVKRRYPYDINVQLDMTDNRTVSDGTVDAVRAELEKFTEKIDGTIEAYPALLISGRLDGDTLYYKTVHFDVGRLDELRTLYIIQLDDYNLITGSSETLGKDEVLVSSDFGKYRYDTLTIEGEQTFRVKKILGAAVPNGDASTSITDVLFVIVPDFESTMGHLSEAYAEDDVPALEARFYAGINSENMIDENDYTLQQLMATDSAVSGRLARMYVDCDVDSREDYFGTFGGLLFLGIILSIVFGIAAVLIIYYKQISEGYEDRGRFEIMQKVGMDKKAIKRSINSQLLTVFYMPLIAAAVHLAFAFPMIKTMLRVFSLKNAGLFALTTVISFVVFALIYMLVYKITAGAYYRIVSSTEK